MVTFMLFCVVFAQDMITSLSSVAAALLLAGHSCFVNLLMPREWQDLGATHEEDLHYKAVEIRVELKRAAAVCQVLYSV